MTAPALDAVAVLVPVKAFDQAKVRLAPALDAAARVQLAREMATNVVEAAGELPVAVVCDDRAVARWALDVGATVIWRPGRGLNGAVHDGVTRLAEADYAEVIVAHADLPYALDFAAVAGRGGVTLVPDRHRDGTNVACIPAKAGFEFSYGPGSFARHCHEARRLGFELNVVHEPRLAWDVDVPDDLAVPGWLTT